MSRGIVIWLMGLPSSGKTTLGKLLVNHLRDIGLHAVLVDSDNVRMMLFKNPGYNPEEKLMVYRVLGIVSHHIVDSGGYAVVAATGNLKRYVDEFCSVVKHRVVKIYLQCSIDVLRMRDYKGIYRGEVGSLETVPGVGEPFESSDYDFIVDTESKSPEESLRDLLTFLEKTLDIPLEINRLG